MKSNYLYQHRAPQLRTVGVSLGALSCGKHLFREGGEQTNQTNLPVVFSEPGQL